MDDGNSKKNDDPTHHEFTKGCTLVRLQSECKLTLLKLADQLAMRMLDTKAPTLLLVRCPKRVEEGAD